MNYIAKSMFSLASILCLLLPFPGVAQQQRTPVLVELFTSEGCSSCPPADALLAKLEDQPIAGAEVIALGEHVDYWNGIGWRDRFSSRALTDRQSAYGRRFQLDSIYTPQMVVDGEAQLVGSDAASAARTISQAAKQTKLPLVITDTNWKSNELTAHIALTATKGYLPHASLYVALIDRTDTTNVRGGENGGRQLTHVAVVRNLQRVGTLQQLSQKPLIIQLALPEATSPQNTRLVAFAQKDGQGRVLAVAIH